MHTKLTTHRLRAGMVGMGMIFDETYRPLFERLHAEGLYRRAFGHVEVPLVATASRTGARAQRYKAAAGESIADFAVFSGESATDTLLDSGVDFVAIATPDNRHFEAAQRAIAAGKHVLIEKPSVLRLQELDTLNELAAQKQVLARVVYHKLFDPDHKKLRTLVMDRELAHVNNGYCSLLEPKQISGKQFAEWISGRNPGTYVAVHYIKLIDFTFGGRLKRVMCTGQRGLVGPSNGSTWDSTQLRLIYTFADDREAAFDIHTSWVSPDNFPGYVEQEVQFRFDNGIWNAHQRKRGVELTIEGITPVERKTNIKPWNARTQRGYGIEAIERFVEEVALIEFAGPISERAARLDSLRQLDFSELGADRPTVAAVQAMEAILERHAVGSPDSVVHVNHPLGGLVLFEAGRSDPDVLYRPAV
jgi:predicted dehydrogenase